MIDLIYTGIDVFLPFEIFSYPFMKNALLAILLITPLFGLLSTLVVMNRMAFFADSIGHGAYAGIAVGVLLGSSSPLLSLIAFSILFAVAVTLIKEKSAAGTDTVISVFSAAAAAAGLMAMSKGGTFNKFTAYLVGDILSITPDELTALFIVFIIAAALWVILFNRLLLLSINPVLARSRGIKTLFVECLFASAVACLVAVAIEWVGILIINSLLVLPGAAAKNIATDIRKYHLFSVGIAIISGLVGLIAAYYLDIAVGATVVLVAAAIYFLTLAFKR